MSDSHPPRTSAAKAGWVVGVILATWLVFLLVPAKRDSAPPEPIARVPSPPSRLAGYGLPDNPVLEMLPAFFEVWAEQAAWRDDRTRIAWWDPFIQDFGYFFEVTRSGGRYRFSEISKPEGYDEEFSDAGAGSENAPLRLIERALQEGKLVVVRPGGGIVRRLPVLPPPPLRIPVDLPQSAVPAPAPDIKIDQPGPAPKK